MRYLAFLAVCAVFAVPGFLGGCSRNEGREQVFASPTERIATDEVVVEFGDRVGRTPRVALGAAPRIEGVQPARSRGRRLALVAPPPSAVEYDLDIPPHGRLRFGISLVGAGDATDEDKRPVRFRVRVDGEEVWEHLAAPSEDRVGRHWFDVEVPLDRFAGRRVSLTFETEAPSGEAADVRPAWSRLQLVRRTEAARQRATPSRPNVILLVVDTLRADRLGVYGARPSRTPNLDAMAATGVVFRHVWAQAPWTLPSIATILTGRYPHAHGVVGRSAAFGRPAGVGSVQQNWAYLSDTIPTIASRARQAGLTTLGVTANLLISRENNLAHGFETFVEVPMSPMPVQWARASMVHATFERWLTVNRGWRFFAYLHYMEPHDPYVPTPALRAECPAGAPDAICDGIVRHAAREREEGGTLPPLDVVRYLERLYDGEVRAWDRELPELLRVLERQGVRDRTVLVVTADHGEEFGEHGHLGHRKQLYPESLAVPLIVIGPGIRPAVREDLAELVDVFPTVLGILGVGDSGSPGPPSASLPGHDLLAAPSAREETYAETRYGVVDGVGAGLELLGIRRARWAYQRAPASAYERLYAVDVDPEERVDVAPENPAVAAQMAGALDAWRARWPADTTPPEAGEAITDKLRALGYVE